MRQRVDVVVCVVHRGFTVPRSFSSISTQSIIIRYNTRLAKIGDKKYTVKIASSQAKASETKEFEGCEFVLEYGDYGKLMGRVVENLQKAKEVAANVHQKAMLDGYNDSFSGGSIDAHKDGSRSWIKVDARFHDKGRRSRGAKSHGLHRSTANTTHPHEDPSRR